MYSAAFNVQKIAVAEDSVETLLGIEKSRCYSVLDHRFIALRVGLGDAPPELDPR
jgi:hypothetical protein